MNADEVCDQWWDNQEGLKAKSQMNPKSNPTRKAGHKGTGYQGTAKASRLGDGGDSAEKTKAVPNKGTEGKPSEVLQSLPQTPWQLESKAVAVEVPQRTHQDQDGAGD